MIEKNIIREAKKILSLEIQGLIDLRGIINKNFVQAIKLLHSTKGRVIVSGIGKSGHIANKISSTLSSLGTPSQFIHPAEASHGDLGVITKNDTVIIISNSGDTPELNDLILHVKRFSIPLIGIVKNKKSTLAKSSNIVVMLPKSKEACLIGLAPTTSTTAALALGDTIAISLMKLKNFSTNHFKQLHPGGIIGKSLLKVKDLMHTGNKIPLVNKNKNIKTILNIMTKKSLGSVGILNNKKQLIGIITDGDIRRNFGKANVISEKIMNKKPITTTKDTLVVEAIEIMNEKKITCLFVSEKNIRKNGIIKPIGILHIHDCLRAGIM
jgi:arabinose-5-phosphate isomerase